MKKGIVIGLMAILAMSGCQVKEMGDLAPVREAKVFTATIEDDAFVETKTSLDNYGNVLWKMGDQVSIFAGSTINEQYQVTDASDGKTAAALNRVTNPGFVAGTDIDNNVALYPYAATAGIAKNESGYVISDIVLPATQNYAEGSFGNGAFPMTAVTGSTSDYNLKFKNVLGGLKLQLKGTATIASISVTGNSNEILCGAAEITVANGSVPSISLTDATAKTVTLDCGNGVQLNTETETPFIIALPAMTMEGGFTVTVTDTEGKQMEIKTTRSQTITRSRMLKMPAVNYEGIPIPDPFDVGSNLSLNGTANCYIVTNEGDFYFDASVMGNGPEGYLWGNDTEGETRCLWPRTEDKTIIANGTEIPAKAYIIWNEGNVLSKVSYDADTKRINITATGNKGAALIGLFEKGIQEAYADESPVIWSWLIWCTDSPQEFKLYDLSNNEYVFLDRNVGAISADPSAARIEDTYGYFFQFGRKDPLRAYVGMARDIEPAGAEMKPAVESPTTFYGIAGTRTYEWYNSGREGLARLTADLWGNPQWKHPETANNHPARAELYELKKTIYDPCPPGYMVPPEYAWEQVGIHSDDTYSVRVVDTGVMINTENGETFYPNAGYISDINTTENANRCGWYAFNGFDKYTTTHDESRVAGVYTSHTDWHPGVDTGAVTTADPTNHYGATYIAFYQSDPEDIENGVIRYKGPYYHIRQRGYPVRCIRELNPPQH